MEYISVTKRRLLKLTNDYIFVISNQNYKFVHKIIKIGVGRKTISDDGYIGNETQATKKTTSDLLSATKNIHFHQKSLNLKKLRENNRKEL